jgi:hypothetical protein
MLAVEAHTLCVAAEAASIPITARPFNTPEAKASIAANGPGTVDLPLVVVGGRYCLQRPTFAEALACIEVMMGTQRKLPASCATLPEMGIRTVDGVGPGSRMIAPTAGQIESPSSGGVRQ